MLFSFTIERIIFSNLNIWKLHINRLVTLNWNYTYVYVIFLYRRYHAVPYLFLSLGLHTETTCICFQSWCGWVSMLITTDQHGHCTEKLVFPRNLQNKSLFDTNLNCDLGLFPVSESFQPLMCFCVFFSKWLRKWHVFELGFVRAFEKVCFGNLKNLSEILPGNPKVL